MIALSAPSSPGDVAPIGSPEDGRVVTLVAAARRWSTSGTRSSRCGGSWMTWPPSRPSWSDGCTGSGSTSMPEPRGHAGRRAWTLLGHLLMLLQLAVIAAGHAGLLPVALRVGAAGG